MFSVLSRWCLLSVLLSYHSTKCCYLHVFTLCSCIPYLACRIFVENDECSPFLIGSSADTVHIQSAHLPGTVLGPGNSQWGIKTLSGWLPRSRPRDLAPFAVVHLRGDGRKPEEVWGSGMAKEGGGNLLCFSTS